jgi:isoamylase
VATDRSLPQNYPYAISAGQPRPLGATADAHGVNFALYCGAATAVALVLFLDEGKTVKVIQLDPLENHTFRFWHVYVLGLRPGARYGFRLHGPQDVHCQGDRYDWSKVLLDPYARSVDVSHWDRDIAAGSADNGDCSLRGVVAEVGDYDWEGDHPLSLPMSQSIIYETHVGGFTRSPSAGCASPGTFLGLAEKVAYLRDLGITAVELLPVGLFDPGENRLRNPLNGAPLANYWGYSTIGFFSPHPGYCVSAVPTDGVREFRDMVKALHRAGIEVILDVVFNHTGEGTETGPTISFRGLDNASYYLLQADDKALYQDFSGCGNTVICNHPIVMKLILDCLEYWVRELHVDGFRFDEATIMSRGVDGQPLAQPPVIWAIELSDELANTKVIAEAWDAGGLYEVGRFPGYRWAVWNGRFRDDVRRFVRGDPGMIGAMASRIGGSADVFSRAGSLPINSVNFVTCHDGFTLNDLVSYNQKHNLANGENNRDGTDDNASWNCGVEGPTEDPEIEALRLRQMKNLITILMVSQGVPMLLAGDELCRTQGGNNNAYCQDNEISWFDWRLRERNAGMFRFFQQIIAFRKRNPGLLRGRFFTGEVGPHGWRDIAWHGLKPKEPAWSDQESRCLAFTLVESLSVPALQVMFNMGGAEACFELPEPPNGAPAWLLVIDTSLPSPGDIAEAGDETAISGTSYLVASHSVVVLLCRQVTSPEHEQGVVLARITSGARDGMPSGPWRAGMDGGQAEMG